MADPGESSLDRALADVEMLSAAYPDETKGPEHHPTGFPLVVVLLLSETAHIELEFVEGYPVDSNIQIVSYRSNPSEKVRMEATVAAVRTAANECLQEGIEGGMACVGAALDTWNDSDDDEEMEPETTPTFVAPNRTKTFKWITGEPLLDRKSTFQAHACRVASEGDVKEALHQLLDGNSKLQRATHNMYAYRFHESLPDSDVMILKHDNDDDGEVGAGSRLAHLLEMRKEDRVLVVVSRWFGGIHLGPKRFAHISNVARDLLTHCHEKEWSS